MVKVVVLVEPVLEGQVGEDVVGLRDEDLPDRVRQQRRLRTAARVGRSGEVGRRPAELRIVAFVAVVAAAAADS